MMNQLYIAVADVMQLVNQSLKLLFVTFSKTCPYYKDQTIGAEGKLLSST